MFVRTLTSFLICLLGFLASTANAQSEARVRVVIQSISQIEDDLKWLVELSPTTDLKKQWKTLKEDLLDSFTQGVDLNRPLVMDLVFRKDELAYEYRIPLSDLQGKNGFLESLRGIGFKNIKEITKGSYFEFAERNKKPYFLRFDRNYAWIAKTPISAGVSEATADAKPLLELKKDVVASLKNDAEGIAARQKDFAQLRQQFEALIKFRRNEDPNAFDLRKLALVQQLNEAERFVVETEDLQVSWTTSTAAPNPNGRGEISLTALPGTNLLKSIQEFAVKPSYFANVTLHADPIASGKLNVALDAIRVSHLKEFYKSVRPTLEAEIAKLPDLSDVQKTATKQETNKFLDMLDSGLSLQVVDAFADGFLASPGKYVLVCGIRSADGKVADEIVKLLPQIDAEWIINPTTQEHGGVVIHELTVPKSRLPAFQKIFAGETVIYVGTSHDAVWGAAGTEAVKYLTAAIDQIALPAPEKTDPVVVSYHYQLEKLLNLMDLVQNEMPKGTAQKSKEQIQHAKDIEKYRKLAHDAMNGCTSVLQGELRRTGDKIEGYLEVNECVLKYIGSMIADGVKILQ